MSTSIPITEEQHIEIMRAMNENTVFYKRNPQVIMNIGIIFFTAVANILLQVMSRNIIYAYVFVIYTLGAMAIDLFDKKYGKILVAAIFFAYAFLIVNCIYNHIIYDGKLTVNLLRMVKPLPMWLIGMTHYALKSAQ